MVETFILDGHGLSGPADPERPWVGMENLCNKEDMGPFYSLTKITIDNGNKTGFLLLLGRVALAQKPSHR
jgi:hypothetical protein